MRLYIEMMPMNIGWMIMQQATGDLMDCQFSYNQLHETKSFVDAWRQQHPDGLITVRSRSDSMLVTDDGDWALALLKFAHER